MRLFGVRGKCRPLAESSPQLFSGTYSVSLFLGGCSLKIRSSPTRVPTFFPRVTEQSPRSCGLWIPLCQSQPEAGMQVIAVDGCRDRLKLLEARGVEAAGVSLITKALAGVLLPKLCLAIRGCGGRAQVPRANFF